MTAVSNKYNKLFSIITLYLYVTFLIVAVFHYHPYETNNTITVSSSTQDSNNNVKDPFLDDQANCRLVQFGHSYYSVTTFDTGCLELPAISENAGSLISVCNIESLKLSSNQFRAPPIS